MNISDDMLTPEERELARLLGRPAPALGPSARVDADILAMARAPQAPAEPQLATPPQRHQTTGWGRRRRVFSSLAAAASLVLVVGLAWQLRPLTPPPPVQQDSADEASSAAPVPAPPTEEVQVAAEPDPAMPAPPPLRAMAPPAPAPVVEPAPKVEAPPIARSAPVPVSTADAVASPVEQAVLDTPYAADLPAAAPVFAPAPPAPPAPAATAPLAKTVGATQAQQAAVPSAESRERAMQFRAPTPPTDLAAARSNVVGERAQRQQAIDIDADASLSRYKWLHKIRERRDSGDIAGARASLHRFAQDYPEARIPRDLRPLLKD